MKTWFGFIAILSIFILTACFTPTMVTVHFDTKGGEPITPIVVEKNGTIQLPTPVKTGHTFSGWMREDGLPAHHAMRHVESSMTLTATWEVNTYKLYIQEQYEPVPTISNIRYKAVVNLPQITKEGHIFLGYYNLENGEHLTELTMPNHNVFVETRFQIMTYTVELIEIEAPYVPLSHTVLKPEEVLVFINAGFEHTAIITSDNQVFLWGNNTFGQLGDGTGVNRTSPRNITASFFLQPNETVTHVLSNGMHTMARSSFGRVFTWGGNNYGAVGDGSFISRPTRVDITNRFDFQPDDRVIEIGVGRFHNVVLTEQGDLFAWGDNKDGQLGIDDFSQINTPTKITKAFPFNAGETPQQLVVGDLYNAVITNQNQLYVWGNNTVNLDCDAACANEITPPTNITALFALNTGETIIDVALGTFHAAIITSEGRVFTWGNNALGQLGNLNQVSQTIPIDITPNFDLDTDETVVKVVLGGFHSMAITSKDTLYVWGANNDGQLGIPVVPFVAIPTRLDYTSWMSTDETIGDVSLGMMYSTLLSSKGRLYTWGSNDLGQLGDGSNQTRHQPSMTAFRLSTTLARVELEYGQMLYPNSILDTSRSWYYETLFFNPVADPIMIESNLTIYSTKP